MSTRSSSRRKKNKKGKKSTKNNPKESDILSERAYEGNFDWKISNLSEFKKADNGVEFCSDEFEIGPNIKWVLRAYPNAKSLKSRGHCMLYLVLTSFPIHFTKIVLLYQLHCAETASNFSLISTMSKVNDSAVWFEGVLKNSELLELDPSISHISFQCHLRILRLESFENVLYSYPLRIDLQKQKKFVLNWEITGDMLSKFRNCTHGKFISNNLICDDIWSLQCAPAGFKYGDDGCVRLFMQLCAMPIGVKSIKLQRTLECLNANGECRKTFTRETAWGYNTEGWNRDQRQNSGWGQKALMKSECDGMERIHFRATINILSFETESGDTVRIKGAVNEDKANTVLADAIDGKNSKKEKKKRKRSSSGGSAVRAKKKIKTDSGAGLIGLIGGFGDAMSEDSGSSSEEDSDGISEVQVQMDDCKQSNFEWNVSSHVLRQMKGCKYRQCFTSDKFEMDGFSWQIEVYPRGQAKSDNGSCVIFVSMVSEMGALVGSMTVLWTLYYKQRSARFTSISMFTEKANSFGFKCGGLADSDFDCAMLIGCDLRVLKRNAIEHCFGLKTGDYPRKLKFEWQIESGLFAKVIGDSLDRIQYLESPIYHKLWCLRCVPIKVGDPSQKQVDLVLQCCALPVNVFKMKVHFMFECKETKSKVLYSHTFTHSKSAAGSHHSIDLQKINENDGKRQCTFKVTIEIKAFLDAKGKKVIETLK